MKKIDKKDYAMACMQLNVILSNLPEKERRKIPDNILNEIKRYKSNKYVYKYDFNKTLLEQEMLSLTKELLYYIYTKYLVIKESNHEILMENNYSKEYKEASQETVRDDRQNDEDEKREKYNPNDIFKRNKTLKTVKEEIENSLPIEIKEETFFQKMVRFFKKCLR